MKVFILIVIMHVNSGGIINFQEFNSIQQCNYAAELINTRGKYEQAQAFCIAK